MALGELSSKFFFPLVSLCSFVSHPNVEELPPKKITLRLFNIAMENSPFIDDFPS
jgi:hypothetical protein